MKDKITRRDFLKLAGLLPLSVTAPHILNSLNTQQKQQNVLIIVFDAFSAYNMSLYGYQRQTTPNIARLADRAVVYHNHYAGGNYTTPGTASLLTGTLPWKHRAFNVGGPVEKIFTENNFFTAFQNCYRISYSHNLLVNTLEEQLKNCIDYLMPRQSLFLNSDSVVPSFLKKDEDIYTVSWVRYFDKRVDGVTYSLYLSFINLLMNKLIEEKYASLKTQFPRGIPGRNIDFVLEDAIDWLQDNIEDLPQPFAGYFHFLPPHHPYRTHQDFYGHFRNDGIIHGLKPLDVFGGINEAEFLNENRMQYDEFILYVDREFDRLFSHLDQSGLLENTWIILTSDHGEMFERGHLGHQSPVLYEPVVRIPLLIFEPGRTTGTDVYQLTSAIDILPTLLQVTGQKQADWTDGVILPPYNTSEQKPDRSIYLVEAKKNKREGPLTTATVALVKGKYKLTYFFGYEKLSGGERIELYDLDSDPEELNNLSSSKPETTAELLNEIKQKLSEVNEPYL